MRKVGLVVFSCLLMVASGTAIASDLRPLSPQDAARVQELLKSFDPNSYDIRFHTQDAKGQLKLNKLGRAVGLANLRQTNTVRPNLGGAASTVNTINIFKTASSVNTINIFKEAAPGMLDGSARASSVNTINIFKTADQQQKAQELNQILSRYYVP
jgi:hypothetical protein